MRQKPHEMTARQKRHRRVRARVIGTNERPRLNVFRSLNHIYAQLIDDSKGHTLAAASTRAKEAGITNVVFDRGGYLYHGRIKALAEGAREGGLDF